MTGAFGPDYARLYDLLYSDKAYGAECDLLEDVFAGEGRPIRTVLDIGCGTGLHAVELGRRGYEVVGVDLSEAMLRAALERATRAATESVSFVQGDIRELHLGRQFDAVVCMFAVLSYQVPDEDVAASLATVRRHLEPGGVFVFDVWYGPAVDAIGPSDRTKTVSTPDGEVERRATSRLDPKAHTCTVSYELTARRPGEPDAVTRETHRMRYFYRDELEEALSAAGLRLVELRAFPDVRQPASASSWNVIATAAG